MKTELFIEMLNDKNCFNYEKLKYKYGKETVQPYINSLKAGFFTELPLKDSDGNSIYYMPAKIQLTSQKLKSFMQSHSNKIGIAAMTDEIISTLSIENINSSRESVREILEGFAPATEDDKKAFGIKQGLDFISDISNVINEENLYKLYMLSCGEYTEEKNRLLPGNKYRHDKVYVVGNRVSGDILHEGADFELLPQRIAELISFINDGNIDDITKSIIAHYYFAYLHPYFDGNGRTARLLQMWILVQKGYSSILYLPFSKYINEKKESYYKTFELISKNSATSKTTDITPFISFFAEYVINRIGENYDNTDVINKFNLLLENGMVTPKEKELFYFVLSNYGYNEFSTKDIEKDFRNVAYATVRSFCMKLENSGIFVCTKMSNRVKYKLNNGDFYGTY